LKRARATLEKQRAELAETEHSIGTPDCGFTSRNPARAEGFRQLFPLNIHTQKEETIALNPKLDFRETPRFSTRKPVRASAEKR